MPMNPSGQISSSLKSRFSAWILMAMVLATVVPFNLLHSHEDETLSSKEVVAANNQNSTDHDSCDHKVHFAEEQEICFLCHFSFVSVYKMGSPLMLEELSAAQSKFENTLYNNRYSFVAIYAVLNKGSPLA